MPMSRIARTHLLYQFIILTLVFLGVGYDELLLERRVVMFLLVVPTFLYQLLVLSCCTELIPVPRWMDLSDSPSDASQEQNNGISRLREDDTSKQNKVLAMSGEPNNLNNCNQDLKVCARKYKFRNWKASNLPLQSPVSAPGTNEGTSLEYNNSGQIQSPEPTKKYFFPYRQKRLEQWIDPKDNSRPFKIRSWQSNASIDESSTIPTSNTTDLKTIQNLDDSSVPDDYSGIPESELTKRYTFPFRQKRSIESDDNEMNDSANLPPTPYWRTVGYSLAVKQEARRRRRSVSSSLLTTRQMNRRQEESDKSKDFSQSVEISRSPINDSRGNSSKSPCSTTFAKMKLGFVNCFSKIKRVNSKTNLNKGFDKKRSLKSMFQSRENINLEPMEKEYRSKPKVEIEESNCDFYPSYIPFQKERFETDVRKRMLELPKT